LNALGKHKREFDAWAKLPPSERLLTALMLERPEWLKTFRGHLSMALSHTKGLPFGVPYLAACNFRLPKILTAAYKQRRGLRLRKSSRARMRAP